MVLHLEFGGKGSGPGQFNGVHALAVGPGRTNLCAGPIRRPHQHLQNHSDPAKMVFVENGADFNCHWT